MSDSEERQQAFVEARKAGETYDAIARRHGVTEGTVRYWVRKAGAAGPGSANVAPGDRRCSARMRWCSSSSS